MRERTFFKGYFAFPLPRRPVYFLFFLLRRRRRYRSRQLIRRLRTFSESESESESLPSLLKRVLFFFWVQKHTERKDFLGEKMLLFFLVIKLKIGRHVGFVSKCLKMAVALVHDGVWRLCLVHAKMAALSFVLFGMNLVNFFPQTMKRSGFRV